MQMGGSVAERIRCRARDATEVFSSTRSHVTVGIWLGRARVVDTTNVVRHLAPSRPPHPSCLSLQSSLSARSTSTLCCLSWDLLGC